jgi:hypothetical protein
MRMASNKKTPFAKSNHAALRTIRKFGTEFSHSLRTLETLATRPSGFLGWQKTPQAEVIQAVISALKPAAKCHNRALSNAMLRDSKK